MKQRSIRNSVVFVTGANRGIGRALVEAFLAGGARKVYAGARKPETLEALVQTHGDRLVPVKVDLTDAADIRAAAEQASDVTILVNNAGVAGNAGTPITDPVQNEFYRTEIEVNVLGLLHVTQAFAPILEANGGGAIVNLGSVASLVNFPLFQSYSTSKAAVHSITQALRVALPDTLVVGVYPGPIDTEMAEDIPFEKTPPSEVAREVLAGIEAGREEVLPDYMSREMGGAFFSDPKALERQVQAMAAEMASQAA